MAQGHDKALRLYEIANVKLFLLKGIAEIMNGQELLLGSIFH